MKRNKNYLYGFLFILTIVSIISPRLFCQQFKLTDIYSHSYSLDRVNQLVYFKDYLTDTVRTVNLENMEVTKTRFLYYPPVVSNKFNYVVHMDTLYDFENNLQYHFSRKNKDSIFVSPNSVYQGSFSPNDEVFMFGNTKSYFPLNDLSSLNPLETGLGVAGEADFSNDVWPQWSSDSSFIFLTYDDTVMVEFFLNSKRLDTLTTAERTILGWAYNPGYKILAYSIMKTDEQASRIYFHYEGSDRDSLIFCPERDDSANISNWNAGAVGITSLCWSPDNTKLAFLSFNFIDISAACIYLYSLDSNRVYMADEETCGGLKYHLNWANNDTLVYVNETETYVYGMDVSSLMTSIEEEQEESIMSYGFDISNYPNPFNSSTRISISLPENTGGHLCIYDALGRLIKEYHIAENTGKTEIIWNGKNAGNRTVASGVYFGVIKAEDSNIKETKTVKMIYLK